MNEIDLLAWLSCPCPCPCPWCMAEIVSVLSCDISLNYASYTYYYFRSSYIMLYTMSKSIHEAKPTLKLRRIAWPVHIHLAQYFHTVTSSHYILGVPLPTALHFAELNGLSCKIFLGISNGYEELHTCCESGYMEWQPITGNLSIW